MIMAVSAALLGVATFWILAPVLGWSHQNEPADPTNSKRAILLAARQEILSSIKDLEMEYQVGKLTEEDFVQTREQLAREAVSLFKKLDQADDESNPKLTKGSDGV